jgi:hypothetical protein
MGDPNADDFISDLDRPAGERAAANPGPDPTRVASAFGNPAPPTAADPTGVAPLPQGATGPGRSQSGNSVDIDDTKKGRLSLPLSPQRGAGTDRGVPLGELIKGRGGAGDTEPPASVSESARTPAASRDTTAQWTPDPGGRLEKQIMTLSEQVRSARLQAAHRKKLLMAWVPGGLLAGLLTGFVVGRAAEDPEPPRPALVLVAPNKEPTQLAYKQDGRKVTERDVRDAEGMLKAAYEHLEARRLNEAENILRLCIQVADLPECHRTLGSLFAFTFDPRAAVHLRRFVELAPHAAGATSIRRMLDE